MLDNNGKANVFIIIGIVVANLILSYFLFTFVIAKKMMPPIPEHAQQLQNTTDTVANIDDSTAKEEKSDEKKSSDKKSAKKSSKKKKNSEEVDSESGDEDLSDELNLEAKDYFKEYSIFNLEDIVVMPQSNSSETHYLVIKMGFEYHLSDKKLPDELKNKIILITDNISFYLSSQSLDDLSKIHYRSVLKDEIKSMVNQVLTQGEITNVLFAQYIIQ
jgi:flagellar basal body-associated protein FliL